MNFQPSAKYQRELRTLAKSKLGLKKNASTKRLLDELNTLENNGIPFTEENLYYFIDQFKKANNYALGIVEPSLEEKKQATKEKRNRTIQEKKQREHTRMIETLRQRNEAERERIQAVKARRRRTREYNVITVVECSQTWKEFPKSYPITMNHQKVFEGVEEDIPNLVNDFITSTYPIETPYYEMTVSSYSYQIVQEFPTVDIQDVPLRKADPVKLSYLKYFKDINKCSYDDYEGECVLRMLMAHLDIKKRKTMIEAFEEASKVLYPQKGNWKVEDGITPRMILHFCQEKNISCLGFDQRDNLFVKYCRDEKRTRKYPSLIYYACVGHFYIITDPKIVAYISKSFADRTFVKSSILVEEKKESDKIYIEFEEYAEEHNINVNDEPDGSGVKYQYERFFEVVKKETEEIVIIFQTNSLNRELQEYFKLFNEIPKVSFESLTIIKSIIIGKCILTTTDRSVSPSTIKTACEKAGIKYKNQSIGTLISNISEKFFHQNRTTIQSETKQKVLDKQGSKCASCNDLFDDDCHYEIDHIRPLSNGGNSEIENLQALCRSCHIEKTRTEKNNCDHFRMSEYLSMFNLQAYKTIMEKHFHRIQFSNFLMERDSLDTIQQEFGSNIYSVDNVKCRRNILLHSGYKFPVYSCLDNIEAFDGKIEEGFFYIESENVFPLRKNGFYSYPMVKFCLEENIITLSNILYQFKPSMKLQSDYFKKFVQHLDDTFDKDTTKLVVNSMIGMFGRRDNSVIDYMIFENGNTDDMACAFTRFTNPYMFDITEKYSFTTSKISFDKLENTFPIYAQILDIEAMELYKLTNLVKKNGGVPICIKTDAVVYFGHKEVDTSKFFWDKKRTIPHYRHEEPSLLKREINYVNMSRFQLQSMEYKTITDTREKNFNIDIAKRILESGKGCFLDGMAGCGKTALVNELVKQIGDESKLKRLTPTNVSALLIDGETIDKFCHTILKNSRALNKCRIKYIFIDEVSMMREKFYGLFLMLKHIHPEMKFIISGDFGQLAPVGDRANFDYQNSRALYELVDGNKVHLTLCRRSDDKLYNLCRDVRKERPVEISEYVSRNWTSFKNICFTNDKRKEINAIKIEEFIQQQGPNETFPVEALKFDKNTQNYQLCQGMPLISRVNKKKYGVLNNEMYQCLSINQTTISVLNENKEIEIPKNIFHFIFMPAFCITTHKSQGLSINENYTIHEFDKFDSKLKYVALSRATNYRHIKIIR